MAEEYDQLPTLRNLENDETITLYFREFNEGASDDTVRHNPPSRAGSIEQDIGRGSVKYTGTLEISKDMDSNGLKGYKDKLKEFARTDYALEITLDNGETRYVSLKEPSFDKSESNSPNKISVRGVELTELDQEIIQGKPA